MYQRPGDFEYKKFEIKNYNGDTIQLSPSVVISLHIFESIFDPYIKAVAIINDTNSISRVFRLLVRKKYLSWSSQLV